MATLWNEAMKNTLTRHDARMRQLDQRAIGIQKNLENLQSNLKALGEERGAEIESFNRKINEVISMQNDPVVYVRNYGDTNLYVYHGSLENCGWVNPRRVRKMLLGQAKAAGLHPCVSCGHLAAPRRDFDTAA
jgi:hypothetical protein